MQVGDLVVCEMLPKELQKRIGVIVGQWTGDVSGNLYYIIHWSSESPFLNEMLFEEWQLKKIAVKKCP